jgi:hypothetical protein
VQDTDTKADVVAHPGSAKVYCDGESRSARNWVDADGVEWVGWQHKFPLGVDDQLLDEMYGCALTQSAFIHMSCTPLHITQARFTLGCALEHGCSMS